MEAVKSRFLDQLPGHEQRRLLALGRDNVEHLARHRCEGTPLQYLEGSAAFVDFEVIVDRRVLIPRPETEGLYELAIALCDSPSVIVDLGTGSGVLAIAMARRNPAAAVHGVDLSPEALELAGVNVARLAPQVHLHHGDLFSPLPRDLKGQIDLVVANPPYVSTSEWSRLPLDVQREPHIALVGGVTGDEVLRRIAADAAPWLSPGALVVCEIGETQAGVMMEAFAPLGEVLVHRDLSDRPRYVSVERAR
ncbi:peptide chain release factor N(5)-glutamine methyltransferase [soil metagenome]